MTFTHSTSTLHSPTKGYFRKASALEFMGRFIDAADAYNDGLKVDPNNQQYKTAMENAIKVLEREFIA